MHDSTAPRVLGPGRMARRDFLRRAGQVGIGVPAAAWLAAARGSSLSTTSSSGAVKGTATILNYAGWMGKNNVSSFEAAPPRQFGRSAAPGRSWTRRLSQTSSPRTASSTTL